MYIKIATLLHYNVLYNIYVTCCHWLVTLLSIMIQTEQFPPGINGISLNLEFRLILQWVSGSSFYRKLTIYKSYIIIYYYN